MKALLSRFAVPVLLFAVILAGCSKDSSVDPVADSGSNNEAYIVVLDFNQGNSIQGGGSEKSQIAGFIASNNIALEKVSFIYTKVLTGFAAELTADQLAKLNTNKLVKYIEKDKLVSLPPITINKKPSNPGNPGSDPDPQPSETTPWGITAVGGALTNTTFTRAAWIIDTGIDLDHPDLNVDVARSETFVTTNPDKRSADDGHGHGTHVAGTVGAIDNEIGVIGVAPGCSLVAVKVLNSRGSGYISWIVAGVNYVASEASDGDVANMSLGGGLSSALDEAVGNLASLSSKSIHVVVAAGNESSNALNYSPANLGDDYDRVYTISAHNSTYYWASFSNYGSPVDWCAPGVYIPSTYKDGGYATMSGTSMAAPHVAGIITSGSTIVISSNGSNGGYVIDKPQTNTYKMASR